MPTTPTTGCGCASAPVQISGPDWWDSAKGWTLTQALAFSGYSNDADGLRAYYRDHKAEIDEYLAHVDVGKLAREIAESRRGRQTQQTAVVFTLGATAGVVGTLLYQRYFNDDTD